jgi:hypothetical protein
MESLRAVWLTMTFIYPFQLAVFAPTLITASILPMVFALDYSNVGAAVLYLCGRASGVVACSKVCASSFTYCELQSCDLRLADGIKADVIPQAYQRAACTCSEQRHCMSACLPAAVPQSVLGSWYVQVAVSKQALKLAAGMRVYALHLNVRQQWCSGSQ